MLGEDERVKYLTMDVKNSGAPPQVRSEGQHLDMTQTMFYS